MKKLTTTEKSRFARHISLKEFGVSGQEKLKNSKVLVVGAGGLGSPLLIYLAAAGVGNIGIVDDDVVDLSNLQRQVLYTTRQVGKKKIEVAKQRLHELYPEIEINCFDTRINEQNSKELLTDYDVIADCSDNFKTRQLIGCKTQQLKIPLAFASVMNYEGQVTVFNYQNGPSFENLYPSVPKDGIFKTEDIGLIGVLPGIAGSLQANEVIKIITGYGEVLSGKLLIFSISENRFNLFSI